MSEMPPPPPSSEFGRAAPVPAGPPPYSASAIAGFVSSLLGCLGITALLGLILGIVGVMKTKDGQRRGMGLAVAAIVLSCITGLVSVILVPVLVFLVALGATISPVVKAMEDELGSQGLAAADFTSIVRRAANDEFNEEVTDDALMGWVSEIRSRHGTAVRIELDGQGQTQQASNQRFAITFDAKFVNGSQPVQLWIEVKSLLDYKLDDFSIGGLSVREFAESYSGP